jgi:predicted kinase
MKVKRKRASVADLRAIIERLEMDKQQLKETIQAQRHVSSDSRVIVLKDQLRQSEEIRTLLRLWLKP